VKALPEYGPTKIPVFAQLSPAALHLAAASGLSFDKAMHLLTEMLHESASAEELNEIAISNAVTGAKKEPRGNFAI
jgi:hypothetical protein